MLKPKPLNQFDKFISNQHKSPTNFNINNYFSVPAIKIINKNHIKSQFQNNYQNKKNSRNSMPRTNVFVQDKNSELRELFCANKNHNNKLAQYMINIDGEYMYYCASCSANAASQGFQVQSLRKKTKILPNYPQFNKNYRYKQLIQLMKYISTLQKELQKITENKIKQQYQTQKQILLQFYDTLIELVNQKKYKHLRDLQNENKQKLIQYRPLIYSIKQKIKQINLYWEDIDQNFRQIMNIQIGIYQASIQQYKKSLNKIEEQVTFFEHSLQKMRKYNNNNFFKATKQFQKQLNQLLNPKHIFINQYKKLQNNQGKITIKQVHSALPKSKSQKSIQKTHNGAFRNLFPQQSQEQIQISPKFKPF